MTSLGRALTALLAASMLSGLSGCVTPATGPASYRTKALESVSATISEVASAREVVDLLLGGRIFRTYADEALSANEDALGAIGESFLAVQPPPEEDRVSARVAELVGRAEEQVRDSRIAARRSDSTELQRLDAALERLIHQLTRAERALR